MRARFRSRRTGEGGSVGGPPPAARPPARDRGVASIEFLGFLPLLLIVALAAVQLGLAAFATQQAGSGARAAARTATLDRTPGAEPPDPEAAARSAMTGWVADRAEIGAPTCPDGGEVTATVTVTVPELVPGTGFSTTRRATMPCPAALGSGGFPYPPPSARSAP
ncbi:TadE-like protein [Streptomyces netropsis]|uniref:Flp pilus assembly protein TadG n=1 Tax=Streptomyces syringium TaxID=76729 RepID=A0ABS4Y7W2_9ACTN|nr:TadE family protein [Streptomyces syringium]MBP2404851.1 Flp pilus assembly protein TadG [Streptomyces syringium]SPE57824.1 TadE-like protein [Streptomyces netropsis]